ncbi:MAG: universal stress protein [Cyclobacteriaceae bacterium]
MDNTDYKRWLVGLDMTDMDQIIIRWVNYFAGILKPEIVYFIHVEKDFDVPDYVPEDLKSSIKIIDESQKETIRQLVSAHFDPSASKTEVEVIEGKPFETLLHWVKVKKIDFFIAGRKNMTEGSGVLPHKLSRRLNCPVLFIPERNLNEIRKILVPLDFSEHSFQALQTAMRISEMIDKAEIHCHHIYQVPIGYHKTGKSYAEFAEIMKNNAEKEFKRFTRTVDRALTYTSGLLKDGTAAELIVDQGRSIDAQLIVMGSKGQTAGSVILLGSTAEKLIQANEFSPTLIVKKKDEHIGFFEALKRI